MSSAAASPPSPEAAAPVARLLILVRALIDYGKQLATTLQQGVGDLASAMRPFGTRDIALILTRIAQGLQRARALEARLVSNSPRLEPPPPRPAAVAASRQPSASPRVAAPCIEAEAADPRLARLPTAEEIADEVRRRPIGAVLADICRDLGILPEHPLWHELSFAIMRYGGRLAGLIKDMLDRMFPLAAAVRNGTLSFEAAAALPATQTGPPDT